MEVRSDRRRVKAGRGVLDLGCSLRFRAIVAPKSILIPRILHRIWLGPAPMPELFKDYAESWRRHNPDWELRLWTDEALPELTCPEAYARARNPAERSDVVRYELLRRFGGVYVDTDVECKRSLEPLIEGVRAFAGFERPGRVGTGVVGSVADHPAMDRMVYAMRGRVGTGDQAETTGPGLLTAVLREFPDVTLFDTEVFCPCPPGAFHRSDDDFPDAYAVHHWSWTWARPEDYRRRIVGLQQQLERARKRIVKLEHQRAKVDARLKKREQRRRLAYSDPWKRLWTDRAGAEPWEITRLAEPPSERPALRGTPSSADGLAES